jgi:hypothetical protein
MLHIAKFAVGVRDIDHIRALQAERLRTNPPLRHRTRNFPRRGQQVLDGGSLYWVISGSMLARQRIVDIVEDKRDDQTKCTAFILDPEVVPLIGRPTWPFQGWQYLSAEAAPAGLGVGDGDGGGGAASGAAPGIKGVVFDLGGAETGIGASPATRRMDAVSTFGNFSGRPGEQANQRSDRI